MLTSRVRPKLAEGNLKINSGLFRTVRSDHGLAQTRTGEGAGAKKIRVNSINPGGTESEGAHAVGVMGSEFEKHLISQTPLGRFGQPGDIAPVAVFLSSEASYWITGEILLASGGMR